MSDELGGRSEVVNAPAEELFKYMDMAFEADEAKAEKERFEIWLNHMSRKFTQSQFGDPGNDFKNAQKEFEQALAPVSNAPKQKELAWDFEKES